MKMREPGPMGWRIVAAVAALLLWIVVLTAENPGLMADDSGETVACAVGLGVPHPPGYPLFNLVGRIAALVPVGTPAFRLNLLSGLFTMGALLFIGLACLELFRRIGPRPAGPWFGAAALASSLLFLLGCRSLFAHALTAKGGVYTLTLLVVSVLTWWRVRLEGETALAAETHRRLLWGVLFLWAVGSANHWETQVLWAPFLYFGFVRRGPTPGARAWLTGATFLVLGLSLYLYLPLRSLHFPDVDWGHPVDLGQFLWVVFRGPYTGIEMEARTWDSFMLKGGEYARILFRHWWPGWTLLAAAGIAVLLRTRRRLARDLLLLYVPVTVAVLIVPHLERGTVDLLRPYLVSTQGWIALTGFCGVLALGALLARVRPWLPALLAVLLLVVAGACLTGTRRTETKSSYSFADDFAVNVLKGLPRGALVLSEGDQFVMTLFHQQTVRNVRRDVVHVPVVFLNTGWGLRDALRKLRGRLAFDIPAPDAASRVRFLLTAHRSLPDPGVLPTYYSLNRGLLDSFGLGLDDRLNPAGLTYEMVAGRAPDSVETARTVWDRAQEQRRRRFPPLVRRDQAETSTLEFYRYYANQYVVAGNTLNQSGELNGALEFYLKAVDVYPFTAEAYSNMAVLFGKEGFLEMAQYLCNRAIETDPDYAGAHDNLGNVFTLMQSYSRAVESYQRALALKPGAESTLKNMAYAESKLREPPVRLDWIKHSSTFYFDMGNRSANSGQLRLAEISYRTAESVGYTYPDLYNNLGVALAQMGRSGEAESAFLRAFERNDRFVEAYKNYALFLLNENRLRDARRVVEKGLGISPSHAELLLLKERLDLPAR